MDEPLERERAALAELERLQEQIRHYRAQRKAATEQFEQFLGSFRTPETRAIQAEPKTVVRQTPRPLEAQPPAAPRVAGPSLPGAVDATSLPSPAPVMLASSPFSGSLEVESPAPSLPAPVTRRRGWRTGVAIGGAAALLAGGAFVTWSLRARPAPPPETANPQAPVPTPAPAAATEPPPAATVAGAAVLTTSRAVWVRVIADGARVLERELPPNVQVPLTAQKTIVIRTGDAGAIRLVLRGRDQGPLGRAGEVVTRTFSVPPDRAR